MEVLLIGGTNAGASVRISEGDTFIDVPKRTAGFQNGIGDIGRERYVLQTVANAHGVSRGLFVVEGRDALDILVESYRG